MAWQNPKLDWAPEDGVRNDDFNRIEGNILHLYDNVNIASKAILANDVSLYVDASSGSDDTGDGTSNAPFATITKALSTVPKNLSGHSVLINLSSGTYAEALIVSGFDAPIVLTGGTWSRMSFDSISIDGCRVVVRGIELYSSGNVLITNGGAITGTGHMFVENAGITVDYGSTLSLNTVTCQYAPGFAVTADHASRVYASTFVGSGNAAGLRSIGGSAICYDGNSMGAEAAFFNTATGGRIYSGAQESAPDY